MKPGSNPLFNRVFHKICGKTKGFLLFFHSEVHSLRICLEYRCGKHFPKNQISSSMAAFLFMTSASLSITSSENLGERSK